jgi:chromosome segregation ATPase
MQLNICLCLHYILAYSKNKVNLLTKILKLFIMNINNKGNRNSITVVISVGLALGVYYHMNNKQNEQENRHRSEVSTLEQKFNMEKRDYESKIASLSSSLESTKDQLRLKQTEAEGYLSKLQGATIRVQELEKTIRANPSSSDLKEYQINLAEAKSDLETLKSQYDLAVIKSDSLEKVTAILQSDLVMARLENQNFRDSIYMANSRINSLETEMNQRLAVQKTDHEKVIQMLTDAFAQEILADRLKKRQKAEKFDAYSQVRRILLNIHQEQGGSFTGIQASIDRIDGKMQEVQP